MLSALHVNFTEIEMGPSLDRGAFGEVFKGRWRGNDIAVKVYRALGLTVLCGYVQNFTHDFHVVHVISRVNYIISMKTLSQRLFRGIPS